MLTVQLTLFGNHGKLIPGVTLVQNGIAINNACIFHLKIPGKFIDTLINQFLTCHYHTTEELKRKGHFTTVHFFFLK